VNVTIADGSDSTTTDIYITVDGPAGSSGPPPPAAVSLDFTLVTQPTDLSITVTPLAAGGGADYYINDNSTILAGSQYIQIVANPSVPGYSIVNTINAGNGTASTWDSQTSRINIGVNNNFGGNPPILSNTFVFTYRNASGNELTIQNHGPGNNQIMLTVYENYQ
jgi:hypothetical protein